MSKYDMTRGVTINGIHSYKKLGAILKSKKIAPAQPQLLEVEIPGMDGKIDLTETVYGEITRFKNRTISIELRFMDMETRWNSVYSDLQNKLHGRFAKVVFDDDKNYFYRGRAYITGMTEKGKANDITIEIDAEPFKIASDSMIKDDWLWDELDFENGVIIPHKWTVNGSMETTMIMPYYFEEPIFTASGGHIDVSYMDYQGYDRLIEIDDGKSKKGPAIPNGETTLFITGKGTLTLSYGERKSL